MHFLSVKQYSLIQIKVQQYISEYYSTSTILGYAQNVSKQYIPSQREPQKVLNSE